MKQALILCFGLAVLLGAPKPVAAQDVSLQFAPPEVTSVPRSLPNREEPIPTALLPEARSAVEGVRAVRPVKTQSHVEPVPLPSESPAIVTPPPRDTDSSQDLFAGGSDSLVARAVGTAEGTRTPEGDRTTAYYGHVDPGNRRWNLGSFSYQHGARSPEQADVAQLNRLQAQFAIIQAKADAHGLALSLPEQLNAIDLANQAPLAALAPEGYVDQLQQAKAQGLQGDDAVLQARTEAFWDPDRQQWDAPGLGNQADSIRQDQARRLEATARTIKVAANLPQSLPMRASRSDAPKVQSAQSPSPQDAPSQGSESLPPPVATGGQLTFARQTPIEASSVKLPQGVRSVIWDDTVTELPNS
jgi:hypothetical protein